MKKNKRSTTEQFDDWAERYDKGLWAFYFAKTNRYIYSILMKELPKKASLLDIGCGTGGLLEMISTYLDGEIVGLDISLEMIKRARYKSKDKNIKFIHCAIEDAEFGDQKFDVIICMNSFHHYTSHVDTVRKINSCLNNEGLFVLLDAYADNWLRKIWIFVLNNFFGEKNVKYFSKKELNQIFQLEGFNVKRQHSYMYFALMSIFEKREQ